ncbi:MAG TPA: putative glycoside hydrolase, partial [Patescibacteria group bacterium]|nr:putative glycoside hydrolase [Patescibacteria group bacterium]
MHAKQLVSVFSLLFLGVTLSLLIVFTLQKQEHIQHAASLFPSVPDTTNNIHVGLPAMTNIASGQSLLDANPPVDEVWNWNNGGNESNYPTIYKGMYFPVDRQPDTRSHPGSQQIAWFQSNHPDWIEYQCDKTTIAYAFGQTYDIPLDTSSPAVLSWLESTFYSPAAQSGNFQHLDFDNFQMTNGGSWSGQRCGHWTGAQGSSTWVQQYSGTNSDPNYRANEIKMAQNLQSWLHANYPSVIFAANFSYDNNYPTDSDSLLSHVDLLFDEQGFSNGNKGPPFYFADSTWLAKAQHMLNFINAGHAWQDINQFGTPFSTLTTADKQWALANYLLLKSNASWIYICGPQEYGTLLIAPEYSAPIGRPLNTMTQSQNVWTRNYSNGLVIVNPSSTQSIAVKVTANHYKDLYGKVISGSTISLGAHTGIVLLSLNAPVSPGISDTPLPSTTPLPTSGGTLPAGSTPVSISVGLQDIGNGGDISTGSTTGGN